MKYASVSAAKTARRTVKIASRPCSGRSRRSRTYARPRPIQATPRTVVATATVSDCRRLGDAFEQERERERREKAGEHPRRPAELRAEQREHEPGVAREHERPQRPRHAVELVQRDEPCHDGEHPEPPAAEPDEAEDRGQPDGRDQDPGPEGAHRLSLGRRCGGGLGEPGGSPNRNPRRSRGHP